MTEKKYVCGFGNYMMGDDGIGIHIIEYISLNKIDKNFEAIEIANDGMFFLTLFNEDVKKILIVDCALIGKEPGEFILFSPEDVETKKDLLNISTHEGDVLKLIEMAKNLNYPIPKIQIMAIQPEFTEMKPSLSKTLSSKLDKYVETIINEIYK